MTALMPYAEPAPDQRRGPDGTPGRCTNLDYCSIGMQRVLVTVPVGEPFVCPECGGKLRPPAEGISGRPWVIPGLRILILVLGIFLGGIWGYLIGRSSPASHPPTTAGTWDSEVKLNTARAALGLPKLQPGAVTAAPPAVPPATASAPPYPPVQARPYPTRTVPLETADPSQHLQNEQRFGQVTVDCILIAAQGTPSCHVGNVRGADTFSAPSLDWLKTLALRYEPVARGGTTWQLDHRWRIIFEDYSGLGPAATLPATTPKPARRR